MLPRDAEEKDGVHRVLRHVVAHCVAATTRLAPHDFRFVEPDREPLPEFVDEAAAMAWFRAEEESVVGAQNLAYALNDLSATWRLAESAYVPLLLTRRFDDLLAVQLLGSVAAEQLDHPVAGVLRARVSLAHTALGNHTEAMLTARRALTLAKGHDHAWSRAAAHIALGRACRDSGHGKRALAEFSAAHELHSRWAVAGTGGHQVVPDSALGSVAVEIALTHLAMGDTAAALVSAEQALTLISRAPHRRRALARAYVVFCRVLVTIGRATDAIGVLDGVLDRLDLEVDLVLVGEVKQELGDAAEAAGDIQRAGRERSDAARFYQHAGHDDLARQVHAPT